MRYLIFAVMLAAATPASAFPDFSTSSGCREQLALLLRLTYGPERTYEHEEGYAARVPEDVRAEAMRYVELEKQLDAIREEQAKLMLEICAAYDS